MNCKNCAAPLSIVNGREHFQCRYCATLHFPGESNESADRAHCLDSDHDLSCPVCERRLSSGALDGQQVGYCEQCRGVLIDNESFSEVIRSRRKKYAGEEAIPTPLDQGELLRKIRCPNCERVMDVFPYYGPGNVAIDSCESCHLIWFDHGEILAIEQAPGLRC